jgi:transposase
VAIRHGYSKDKRPDLKQLVLSLVVNGPAAMPLWMETLDGNSSDQASFHETIAKVKAFQQGIKLQHPFKWVADAALYSKDKLLQSNDYLWLTRVPETLKEARQLIEKKDDELAWQTHDKGYKTASFGSTYGGIKQRWLLVFSSQAYAREEKTLTKKLKNQNEILKKALWHLSNECFQCEQDARNALAQWTKKHRLYQVNGTVVPVLKYNKPGKPKVGEEKIIAGYKIESTFTRDPDKVAQLLHKKGRFILATNDLDDDAGSAEQMLAAYREQQNVEGGFRFLKDPWFMADSVFLKSPKRIEALMMIMTLCLMVQHRSVHTWSKITRRMIQLPNQLREVKNPALRWIFQVMAGINTIGFYQHSTGHQYPWRELITNFNALRKKIIVLFGKAAGFMYGLIQESAAGGVGM